MRVKSALILVLIGLVLFASCDSDSVEKYLKFSTDMLLPQAAIDKSYDFTFTVTFGDDRWDGSTGFAESEITWDFDDWKLNGVEKTEGPTNLTFADGKITGTPDSTEGGLWSFAITIQKGKKIVVKTFYLPISQNVEITTDSILPLAVTELPYSAYFSARYGISPYYWKFDNWTKDGNPVNDAPIGLTFGGAGYIGGQADNSEVGDWTFDLTVLDTSVPSQLSETKTFELKIKLKALVPTNYPNIQAAVDASENGETVFLEAGTYQGIGNRDVDFSGKSLTILGNSQDPTTVVIDCEGTSTEPHRAFYLNTAEQNCVIDGITIKNGSAPKVGSYWYGGAIYMGTGIDLTVQNVNFEDIVTNRTSGYIYGGLIYAYTNCNLTMKNVNALNTEAIVDYTGSCYIYGQLIYAYDGSNVVLEDCNFDGGKGEAYYFYGVMYFYYVNYDFKNVTISNMDTNTGYYRYNYGFFRIERNGGTWENVNIVNNKMSCNRNYTSSYGYNYGFGYFYYTDIVYRNCVFSNNFFGYEGTYSYWYLYGSYHYYGSSIWYDCIFSNNTTEPGKDCHAYGGILRLYYNTAKFYGCHFLMNETASTYMSTSYSYGGLIQMYGSSGSAEFNDCVLAYNKSGTAGAGLQSTYSSYTLTVNNTTFYKNEGYAGGALFAYGNINLNNCILWDNSATYNGNQIYVYSGSPTLTNSCYSNQSGDISGSINPVSCVTTDPYFKETGDIVVTGDCTFSDVSMTVTGTPGTSAFLTEVMRGDMIFLTSDGQTKAIAVVEVVSDTELKVAGYYTGTPGTGAATLKKMDLTPQHTSDGDANDSPCVDSGDNSKVSSAKDIAGNTRIVDGNGNSTPTVDMGAYENQ